MFFLACASRGRNDTASSHDWISVLRCVLRLSHASVLPSLHTEPGDLLELHDLQCNSQDLDCKGYFDRLIDEKSLRSIQRPD